MHSLCLSLHKNDVRFSDGNFLGGTLSKFPNGRQHRSGSGATAPSPRPDQPGGGFAYRGFI